MLIKVMGISRSLRIGFGILAIIAAIELLQTQAVLSAILLFGAAGIVPGTDIVLSPEATMWSLGGVLVASILLIFHKEIIVACMPAAPVELEEQFIAPTVMAEPEVKPITHRPAIGARVFASLRFLTRALPARRKPDLSHHRVLLLKTYALTIVRLRSFWAELQPVMRGALAQSRIVARRSWIGSQRTTRFCLTKLSDFDRWATAKIQQRDDLAEIQKWLRTATKVLVDWVIQVRQFLANFPRKFNR